VQSQDQGLLQRWSLTWEKSYIAVHQYAISYIQNSPWLLQISVPDESKALALEFVGKAKRDIDKTNDLMPPLEGARVAMSLLSDTAQQLVEAKGASVFVDGGTIQVEVTAAGGGGVPGVVFLTTTRAHANENARCQ
jgi:hypothetical protein